MLLDPPPFASVKESAADLAIEQALRKCVRSHGRAFELLPVPVRSRAAGAVQAWSEAFRLAGSDGAAISARIADPNHAPMSLANEFRMFVQRHCTLDFYSHDTGSFLLGTAYISVMCQAFWAREGTLYEPTAALHRLLEASDVAGDIPLGQLRIPAPAFCIVPEAAARMEQGALAAAMVFEHGSAPKTPDAQRWLTFVIWRHESNETGCEGGYDTLRIRIDKERSNKTLDEALANISQSTRVPGNVIDEGLRKALSYVVKVLLYLSLENTPVMHERPYSTAPRTFPGLGQRKRSERLQAVEKLYDRYLVGPDVWAEAPKAGQRTGSTHEHSVRTHWRRGHFRMQPYGPSAAQRRLIFVMPTVVRADRLGRERSN